MPVKKQKTTATSSKSAAPVQIFDVARPGTLPPANATARPVIVTNRPLMQDPMMMPAAVADTKLPVSDDNNAAKLSQKIVIRPLSEQSEATDKALEQQPEPRDIDSDGVIDPATPQTEVETRARALPPSGFPLPSKFADRPASKPLALADNESQPETPSATTNTVSDSADDADAKEVAEPNTGSQAGDNIEALDADKAAAKLEADAKAQDEIDTLVDEKTYFLPINAVVQRRSRHVFIFGTIVIILLAAIWLDIALDAGFVTIPGLQPLTHLFRN
jgi:hypothetical protein